MVVVSSSARVILGETEARDRGRAATEPEDSIRAPRACASDRPSATPPSWRPCPQRRRPTRRRPGRRCRRAAHRTSRAAPPRARGGGAGPGKPPSAQPSDPSPLRRRTCRRGGAATSVGAAGVVFLVIIATAIALIVSSPRGSARGQGSVREPQVDHDDEGDEDEEAPAAPASPTSRASTSRSSSGDAGALAGRATCPGSPALRLRRRATLGRGQARRYGPHGRTCARTWSGLRGCMTVTPTSSSSPGASSTGSGPRPG